MALARRQAAKFGLSAFIMLYDASEPAWVNGLLERRAIEPLPPNKPPGLDRLPKQGDGA